MSLAEFSKTLNQWGSQRIPFFFLIDFEMKRPLAWKLTEIDPETLVFNINGVTNGIQQYPFNKKVDFTVEPIGLSAFEKKFTEVMKHLEYGDSYLTNLTIRTRLQTTCTLKDFYFASQAKYKVLFKNNFLVFSPEIFIQIHDQQIFSFPMKGTIDAALPFAKEKLLSDPKELAEHVTIVDLIRNDLSRVSANVTVSRFRYIDQLTTNGKTLLQVSSEIVGELEGDYCSRLGDILVNLLPAGSITGAPKEKTVEIIRHAEGEARGYYTGVVGVFDGVNFDSGVMIRFLEQEGPHFYYRSGGGITTQSKLEQEYQEAMDKIYVPLN
jgi:para-aminobenzoate synthetase component 1